MRVFASFAFFTDTGLKVRAEDRLGVFTLLELLLLNGRDRLEERLQESLLLLLLLLLGLLLYFLSYALLLSTSLISA